MQLFASLAERGHEQVCVLHDRVTGLRALVASHDTRLGPALAPLRVWPYAMDADAWADTLQRACDLTLKASLAGTDLGGGAITVLGDPEQAVSEVAMRVLGRYVQRQAGRVVITDDTGTDPALLGWLRRETSHVFSLGDDAAAEWTALGTWHGIRASLAAALGHEDYARASFAVQGAGQAGQRLVRLLRASGAQVWVSDLTEARTEVLVASTGAEAVPMQQIYDLPATVFCPCAMSGVLNEDTIPRLRCKIVAGTANHPLKSEPSEALLASRGILYAPDFAINAGDLIALSHSREAAPRGVIESEVARIERTVGRVFEHARARQVLPSVAAAALAAQRISALHDAVPARGRRDP